MNGLFVVHLYKSRQSQILHTWPPLPPVRRCTHTGHPKYPARLSHTVFPLAVNLKQSKGAYYYGDAWSEAGGGGDPCNETSMVEVASGLEADELLDSVGIWQLDDWWYPGQKVGGKRAELVMNWMCECLLVIALRQSSALGGYRWRRVISGRLSRSCSLVSLTPSLLRCSTLSLRVPT